MAPEPPWAALVAFAGVGPLEGAVPFNLPAALLAADATALIIALARLPVAAFALVDAVLDGAEAGVRAEGF